MSRYGPRLLFGFGVAALLVLLTAAAVSIWQGRNDCAHRVQTRDDQRTMWLYALDSSENPLDQRALSFRIELNDRIPALECRGWWNTHPVPIGED